MQEHVPHERGSGRAERLRRDTVGVASVEGQRLLDEDVLVVPERRERKLGMRDRRRGDHDRVELVILQQVVVGGRDLGIRMTRPRAASRASGPCRRATSDAPPAVRRNARARFGPQ